MNSTLIRNALLINEGKIFLADVFIQNGLIAQIGQSLDVQAGTMGCTPSFISKPARATRNNFNKITTS